MPYGKRLLPAAATRPRPAGQVSEAPSLALDASRRAGVAPSGITFTVAASGWGVEDPSRDLRFEWDFGDPGSVFAGLDRVETIWGASANRAFGDRAAHVFHPSATDFAGAAALRYTVRCTATDGSRAVAAEMQVEIANPDLVFAGDRTLLVAPDGDFSGAPVPVTPQPFARARDFQGRTGNRRILFKRGHSYELEGTIVFGRAKSAAQVGAWGDGPAPVLEGLRQVRTDRILRCTKTGSQDEIAIWGLACKSTWDATTETAGGDVHPWGGLSLGGSVRGHVTVQSCRFGGFGNTISTRGSALHLVISDTEVSNWRDYGMLAGSQNVLALVGCRFEQNPEAMGGGAVPLAIRGSDNLQNDHGPLRVGTAPEGSWTLVAQTQLRSMNGWSAGNAGRGVPNRPSHQACLRWNTSGASGGTLRIDRVVAEGGNPGINTSTSKRKNTDRRCDILIDKIVTIGTSNNGGSAWKTAFTGAVCRNFLVIVPPTAGGQFELRPPKALMGYGGKRAAYSDDALEGHVHVYSGTVLDWTNVDKAILRGGMPDGVELRDVILSNVLHHAPFYAESPRDLGEALDFAALFPPSYRGLKWQNRHKDTETFVTPGGEDTGRENNLRGVPDSPVLDAAFASLAELPDGRPTVALPFPASPNVLEAALQPGEKVALDDLLGRLRGPMPHAGALEPR
ncbi:hypothetical protein [Jannaschia sp. W003]|uniref:hypothetical protein n=1 Tax=Jannaschia sp. W003 TaxID=2867012 RepID=UPI0021A6B130|nr:hypothetical protein [Jannaschia sp. W003]UWQ23174.1 hypothetical protein K3554_16670 [Jannaschia sp. W003]